NEQIAASGDARRLKLELRAELSQRPGKRRVRPVEVGPVRYPGRLRIRRQEGEWSLRHLQRQPGGAAQPIGRLECRSALDFQRYGRILRRAGRTREKEE